MTGWPAWFYGPKGESGVFERAEDVPEGWRDSPAAFVDDDLKLGALMTEASPPRKAGRRK